MISNDKGGVNTGPSQVTGRPPQPQPTFTGLALDRFSPAVFDILAERRRQIEVEGYGPSHDDQHTLGELGLAAALYALPYGAEVAGEKLLAQDDFVGLDVVLSIACGWDLKPEPDERTRKVKAAAMLIAEIERMDRAK